MTQARLQESIQVHGRLDDGERNPRCAQSLQDESIGGEPGVRHELRGSRVGHLDDDACNGVRLHCERSVVDGPGYEVIRIRGNLQQHVVDGFVGFLKRGAVMQVRDCHLHATAREDPALRGIPYQHACRVTGLLDKAGGGCALDPIRLVDKYSRHDSSSAWSSSGVAFELHPNEPKRVSAGSPGALGIESWSFPQEVPVPTQNRLALFDRA